MARLSVPITKSSLLALRRQLAFAEEGYDLLEEKRQILVFELMSRLSRARLAEEGVAAALRRAFAALASASLEAGSEALDCAALGVRAEHEVDLAEQRLMGIQIPRATARPAPLQPSFGVTGTTASAELAARRFSEVLPLLAELAELETAVVRLARELRKTQRRCNALSRIFIPDYHETIAYILGALEERERESLVILKLIRRRLARSPEGAASA